MGLLLLLSIEVVVIVVVAVYTLEKYPVTFGTLVFYCFIGKLYK